MLSGLVIYWIRSVFVCLLMTNLFQKWIIQMQYLETLTTVNEDMLFQSRKTQHGQSMNMALLWMACMILMPENINYFIVIEKKIKPFQHLFLQRKSKNDDHVILWLDALCTVCENFYCNKWWSSQYKYKILVECLEKFDLRFFFTIFELVLFENFDLQIIYLILFNLHSLLSSFFYHVKLSSVIFVFL